MSDTNEQPVDHNRLAIERRRPGRQDVHPDLIPLLRRPAGDGTLEESESIWRPETRPALAAGQDALVAARGVAMGLVLSAPLWGAMAMVSFALRR